MGSFVRLSDHRCDRCGTYTPNRIITEFEDGICGACFHNHGPLQCAQDIRVARRIEPQKPAEVLQLAKRRKPNTVTHFLASLNPFRKGTIR
jgi:hypothetical protein